MPQVFIEAPEGVEPAAKQQMMRAVTTAVDEAFPIGDVRVWLREYAQDNVAMDGRTGAERIKPVCFLEAPELADQEAKSALATKVLAAIDVAYRDIANTEETLVLINHYPLENAAWAGRLGSEMPDVVAAMAKLNG
jgi:phenylpyruvate tautomerase PptA (4-oxalocrotonate tautomerase family)